MYIHRFLRDALFAKSAYGGWKYHLWMGLLTLGMLIGVYAYSIQFQEGLVVTGMHDHVSWGIYISNFVFLVGLAAAAIMIVLPAYVLKDVDFAKAVLIGEAVAVSAVLMCLAFVIVDLGGPLRAWHMIPGIGYFNWPQSLLTWDVIVLNGYLLLNLLIPFYILYSHYRGREANRTVYVPLVYLSVFWAVSIHLVTAFLLAGLPARPFWHSAVLGPRFLASAFAAGPAFMILALGVIRRATGYTAEQAGIGKLAMIVTIAAQVNLIMLGSEIFIEFYEPTHHSIHARYLFFGLEEHNALVPWIWTSLGMNLFATAVLTIHPLRKASWALYPACIILFFAIWIDKGLGLVIPGFIPSPLGEVAEYFPSWVEIAVTIGIWSMGLYVFTILVRVGISIEEGDLRYVPELESQAEPEPAG